MTDPVLLRDLLLAGEGLAASVLLPGLAWIAASCFPKQAALRHLIWLAAFIGMLILPPMTLLFPAHVVIRQPAVPRMAATVVTVGERLIAPATVPSASSAVSAQKAPGKPAPVGITTPAPRHLGPAELAMVALALWLTGFGSILLYHAMALLGLSRLRRRCTALPMPIPELQGPWQLRIATQPDALGPLTWGIWRPVILLPHHALSWPRERLVAVLRHEIAHVRRHDMLTQVLAQLVCAFYWPNLLVWLGARRLRREAEIAADDAVLSAGVKPSSYAETLMELAAEFRERSPALAMAAPSTLEARVTSVLTSTQSRSGVTLMDAFKTACLGASAIGLIVLARPDLAVAQQAAPVAPALSAPIAATAAKPVSVVPQALAPIERKAATRIAQADQLTDTAPVIAPQVAPVRQKIAQAGSGEASGANKTPSSLPEPSTFVIRRIDITGLQHIAPSIVLSYLKLPIGVPMDSTTFFAANEAGEKALDDTGLFTPFMEISFNKDGTYHLGVTENPLINQVTYDNIAKIRTVGTLPLARVLLPTFDASPEQVENANKTAMRFKEAFRYCDQMEKISSHLKGSIYTNLGDVVVSDLSPEIQKALAASKPGEALEPIVTNGGIEVIARCDAT